MLKNKVRKLFIIFTIMALIVFSILYITGTKYPETLFSVLSSLFILFISIALIFLMIYIFLDIKKKIKNKDYISIIVWVIILIAIFLFRFFLYK